MFKKKKTHDRCADCPVCTCQPKVLTLAPQGTRNVMQTIPVMCTSPCCTSPTTICLAP